MWRLSRASRSTPWSELAESSPAAGSMLRELASAFSSEGQRQRPKAKSALNVRSWG
jgi:hypothetical protein